jgi:uncharacterized protein YcbX
MPAVARFNITPVKSTSLQHPDTIELGPNGVASDRRFLFIGVEGKRISGGAKAALLGIRSTFDADRDRLTLELPDGTRVEGDAAGACGRSPSSRPRPSKSSAAGRTGKRPILADSGC